MIRPGRPDDVPALPAIEREAARRFRDLGLDGPFLDEAASEADLLAAARDGTLLVASAGDRVVGFALWSRLDRETAWLEEVDVAPAHGGRGLGRALVLAVVDEARRAGAAWLGLRTFREVPWNAPFYARLGFREVEAWSPAVEAVVNGEAARGLPAAARCTMRLAPGA